MKAPRVVQTLKSYIDNGIFFAWVLGLPDFLCLNKSTNSIASQKDMQDNQYSACVSPRGAHYYITVSEWCFVSVFWLSHALAKIYITAGFYPLFEHAVKHASSFFNGTLRSPVFLWWSLVRKKREDCSWTEVWCTLPLWFIHTRTSSFKQGFDEVWLADGIRGKFVSYLDFVACSCVLEINADSGSSWISHHLLLLLSGKCLTLY